MQTGLKKRVVFFSLPIISGLFVQQLYSVIDMALVGQFIGSNALAAVGNASNVIMLFLVVSGGFEMAVEIMVSRLLGAHKTGEKIAITRDILALTGLIGILAAILGWFILPFIYQMIAVPKHLLQMSLTYGRVYLLGLPFMYLYDVSRAALLANEKAKFSFNLLLGSSILNLLLNLMFILGFNLGVLGSALGTVLAQLFFMLITVASLVKLAKAESPTLSLRPRLTPHHVKEVLGIALPTIFQQFVISFSATLIQAWVNPFGKEVILGYVAIIKVMNLTRIVLVGLAQTLTMLSAQLLAQKALKKVRQVYRWCSQLSLTYCLILTVLFIFAPKILAAIFFSPSQNQLAFSFFKNYLYAFIGIQILSVFKFLNEGLLRSMVKMKAYLYCNVGELVVKLLATWLLLKPLATNAFWSGEILARALLLLVSTRYVSHYLKETTKITKKA